MKEINAEARKVRQSDRANREAESVLRRIVLLVCCVSVAACQQQQNAAADQPAQMNQLTERLEALETQQRQLSDQIRQLNREVSIVQAQQQLYQEAAFDPSADEGYVRVDTDLGPVVMLLENVEAYVGGSRVTLRVGNLTSATFQGMKFQVTWGPKAPKAPAEDADDAWKKYWAVYAQWRESEQSKEVEVAEAMQAGAWSRAKITLPGVPPSELGYLRIRASINEIALLRPSR